MTSRIKFLACDLPIHYKGLLFQGVFMKSNLEKTSGLGRKISVDVPVEKVNAVFDRIYKGIQKEANLKGFRKGKAPISLIRTTYSDRARQNAVEDLVSEAYSLALKEHDLVPITQPSVNFEALREDQGFQFTAEFEVRPDVKLKKYEGLKVEKEKLKVDEARVNEILVRLQESRAELVPLIEDRGTQTGDTLEVDFFGKVNGAPLEGGEAKAFKIEIGSNSLIPGFEDGLVGLRVGHTKKLDLKFPEDYGNKDLAGKPVEFDVTVLKIQKKQLPTLDDAFAKTLGDYPTLADLKAVILKDIEADETKRINEEFRSRLLKALVKENPVEVPERLHKQQKQGLLQDVEKRLKNQRMSDAEIQEYKNKWDKDFNETADFMVQCSFLVDALADEFKVMATKDDVRKKMEEYSRQTGLEMTKLLEFYGQGTRLGQIEYQITEEKVVAKLTELSNIKEVEADKLSDT